MFENDVKEYGIQTNLLKSYNDELFENDVKEYGIQTQHMQWSLADSLRMMQKSMVFKHMTLKIIMSYCLRMM